MLQRSHVIVQYAFHVIRTETLNELLAYAATLAFARLHYFNYPSKMLEVGCWQVVRAAAILNIAKNLYLSVLTNKRSLSPYVSLPISEVQRMVGWCADNNLHERYQRYQY